MAVALHGHSSSPHMAGNTVYHSRNTASDSRCLASVHIPDGPVASICCSGGAAVEPSGRTNSLCSCVEIAEGAAQCREGAACKNQTSVVMSAARSFHYARMVFDIVRDYSPKSQDAFLPHASSKKSVCRLFSEDLHQDPSELSHERKRQSG